MSDFTPKSLVETPLSSEEVFNGRLLHVFRDEARLPDGTTSTREWIKHPGASAVIPVFENGDILLIRQFRYPLQQIFWEVPAGKIDKGETPDTTAAREIEEEAGVRFGNSHYLGLFHPSIGYTDEVIHLYIAWNLTPVPQNVDDDEFLVRERMPFEEAVEMVYRGDISDGKTAVTLLKGWHWWKNRDSV
jgi:ADP-ribose pyrophosphatase